MAFWGPYTGDPSDYYSYIRGPHWLKEKGYRVIQGKDKYKHRFGGSRWKVNRCNLCDQPMHQIFTFDLQDPRLKKLVAEGLDELPLVSCLNCSFSWEPKFFKLEPRSKKIEVLDYVDLDNEIMEFKIPTPLPEIAVNLVDMKKEDIPIDDDTLNTAFSLFGEEYLCRILGSPLYAGGPIDRKCPGCKKEMNYVATIGSDLYGNLLKGVEFDLGEMNIYFFFCKNCLVVKTEMQSS